MPVRGGPAQRGAGGVSRAAPAIAGGVTGHPLPEPARFRSPPAASARSNRQGVRPAVTGPNRRALLCVSPVHCSSRGLAGPLLPARPLTTRPRRFPGTACSPGSAGRYRWSTRLPAGAASRRRRSRRRASVTPSIRASSQRPRSPPYRAVRRRSTRFDPGPSGHPPAVRRASINLGNASAGDRVSYREDNRRGFDPPAVPDCNGVCKFSRYRVHSHHVIRCHGRPTGIMGLDRLSRGKLTLDVWRARGASCDRHGALTHSPAGRRGCSGRWQRFS